MVCVLSHTTVGQSNHRQIPLKKLRRNNDTYMSQEHWLLPDDVGDAFSSSAVNTQSNLLTGRSYGGTAILCHRTPSASIKLMTNTRPRITTVEMKVSYRRHVAPFMPFL